MIALDRKIARKQQLKSVEQKKTKKSKKRICSEVTVKVWGIMYSVLKKKKKGCSGKDLQKRKVWNETRFSMLCASCLELTTENCSQ